MSERAEDALRLQFGAAANTIGTQWDALQRANCYDVRLPLSLRRLLSRCALHLSF